MNIDILNPNIREMFKKFENMSLQYMEDHPEAKKEFIDTMLSIMPPREEIDNPEPIVHLPGDSIVIEDGEIKC